MFRTTLATLAAAVIAGGAAQAQTDVQLIRPGDGAMSCEALAAEINALSATQAKAAKRAESGKKFLGFASTALQVAGPMLSSGIGGGDGAMGAIMAQQAMGQMQAQAMQQQAGGAATAPADGSIEGQRLTRLNDMHAQKGC